MDGHRRRADSPYLPIWAVASLVSGRGRSASPSRCRFLLGMDASATWVALRKLAGVWVGSRPPYRRNERLQRKWPSTHTHVLIPCSAPCSAPHGSGPLDSAKRKADGVQPRQPSPRHPWIEQKSAIRAEPTLDRLRPSEHGGPSVRNGSERFGTVPIAP